MVYLIAPLFLASLLIGSVLGIALDALIR